jgi:hypothetical protein
MIVPNKPANGVGRAGFNRLAGPSLHLQPRHTSEELPASTCWWK